MFAVLLVLLFAGHAAAEVELPHADPQSSITIHARQGQRWHQGVYEVWWLRGDCALRQESRRVVADEAVLWIDRGEPYSGQSAKVIAYLEGHVTLENLHDRRHRRTGERADRIDEDSWLGRWYTARTIDVQLASPSALREGEPRVPPATYLRAVAAREAERDPHVRPAQFVPGAPPPAGPLAPPGTVVPTPTTVLPGTGAPRPTARSIVLSSRSSVPMDARFWTDPQRGETIGVVTSGVNLVVDGIQNAGDLNVTKIDVETDRLVVWTSGLEGFQLGGQVAGQATQAQNVPLELYLEGNIVFREGDRVIYAARMYYNVTQRFGLVLNAEALTPVPKYQGLLRLKADVLQQVNQHQFIATGAAMTTSRLGVPEYWLQSNEITVRDQPRPKVDPYTGQTLLDPETGEVALEHNLRARSADNFVYLFGVPVLYWPTIATDLTKPSFYVEGARFRQDSIFGTQVFVDLDAAHLLGLEPPDGVDWTISPGYLSERGPAFGSKLQYASEDLFGLPGAYRGLADVWGIYDTGRDNLGANRRSVLPEHEGRGRAFWQHRHTFGDGWQISAEVGYLSDRNFLEQYFEREWDQWKDQTTGVELKRLYGNQSLALAADVRINDFLTQTESLPRLDHYWLGQPLFSWFTWHAHSHVGYERLRTATLPPAGSEPAQSRLPWETTTAGVPYERRQGLRAFSRQELDLPLNVGPLKIVPYALGEAAFWSQDRDGDDLSRLYGQLGVRSSLPVWTADTTVQSELLNLNGLAHKVSFDGDFYWADATEDLGRLPLYEGLDDDSQEAFRRRFIPDLPGGVLPASRDERLYAFRSGLQSWVAAPAAEIADDLLTAKLGVHQRWQTKRGLPGQERIVDWITLDIDGYVFPKADRDNFGEEAGLLTYDFRWRLGERLTLLSDGFADVFHDGLRRFTVGAQLARPEYGSLYFGFLSFDGPFDSRVLVLSGDYRLSEKWLMAGSAAVDLRSTGNIGESFDLVRIGESLLFRVGINIDHSRGNFGVNFGVEPRFLATSKTGRVGGARLPPAGANGLE